MGGCAGGQTQPNIFLKHDTMDILENIIPCQRFAVSRAEEIARKIEGLILDRAVKPRTCLGTKENLRHRFDVSPATMNEAIRLLQVRDVIVTRRGLKGGVFVATPRAQRTFHALDFKSIIPTRF